MNRQLRMGGGIMNAVPRENYGLGSAFKSITKGVKSAVKGAAGAVKDFAKSDIGKAAIIAGIGFGIPGTSFGGVFGRSAGSMFGGAKGFLGGYGFKPSMQNLAANIGLGSFKNVGANRIFQTSKLGKALGTGAKILGTTAAISGLTGYLAQQGMEEEEIEEIKQNPEVLAGYLEQYYRNLNPPTADTNSQEYEAEVSDFVQRNLKADGGRIGYQDGTPKEGIETLTPMQKPDGDVQYVTDMIKSLDGFAQLIAQKNNLDRQTFQNHMDLFEDFRQRKDIDPMPAYTYLKRRVEELNPEVAKMIYITQEDNPNKTTTEKPKMAMGGRMGFEGGGYTFEDFLKDKQQVDQAMSMEELRREYERMMKLKNIRDTRDIAAYGGRMGYALGDRAEDNAMQASGIMNLPLNQNPAGVTELDLRDSGGFIPPVGVKEKADDIPAMLSNNEFVFTADAVRGMGDGDVNKGAQRMYDMMKKLENGGRV